jgi:hypothetical protein
MDPTRSHLLVMPMYTETRPKLKFYSCTYGPDQGYQIMDANTNDRYFAVVLPSGSDQVWFNNYAGELARAFGSPQGYPPAFISFAQQARWRDYVPQWDSDGYDWTFPHPGLLRITRD